ncbi:hypothetical protein BES08_06950 [Novosphingobium resinovorum]|uniref:HTH cro/C1-type domain-containing protein n=2 Tax=Novosphingobium resinovorum TaxID=158500 RepID=A0A1D8A311_9SPHN|nr:hypothetical protein BES08_06950 [Novosphingobium resinovorum]
MRLEQAADLHPHCPPKHQGRQVWVAEQMSRKGHKVSNETVRKWFEGEAKPRPEKGAVLAEVMGVDPAWLQLGIDTGMTTRDRKVRNAMASGAVNMVAGIIQMDGGAPAFPDTADTRAEREHIDLYAIIKGANYALHVATGEKAGDQVGFSVPSALGENVIVLVLVRHGLHFSLFEATPDIIELNSEMKGGSFEVHADAAALRQITGFTERL